MDIFESLENLNVSEECFEDIIGIVEAIINEVSDEYINKHWDKIADKLGDEKEYADKIEKRYKDGWSCYNFDDVLRSRSRVKKVEDRKDKYENAVRRYKELKRQGKIKPFKKEDENSKENNDK